MARQRKVKGFVYISRLKEQTHESSWYILHRVSGRRGQTVHSSLLVCPLLSPHHHGNHWHWNRWTPERQLQIRDLLFSGRRWNSGVKGFQLLGIESRVPGLSSQCSNLANNQPSQSLASFPGLPQLQFLHTASDQKLELGKAWERGYTISIHIEQSLSFLSEVTSCLRQSKIISEIRYMDLKLKEGL